MEKLLHIYIFKIICYWSTFKTCFKLPINRKKKMVTTVEGFFY